jgi:hypothetical protein
LDLHDAALAKTSASDHIRAVENGIVRELKDEERADVKLILSIRHIRD